MKGGFWCAFDVCYVCSTDFGMIIAVNTSVPGEFRFSTLRCMTRLVGGVAIIMILVLIAPQIRHLRKSIEKLAASVDKPVALIEPFHYATMNGQAVLEQVLSLFSGVQEGQKEL